MKYKELDSDIIKQIVKIRALEDDISFRMERLNEYYIIRQKINGDRRLNNGNK